MCSNFGSQNRKNKVIMFSCVSTKSGILKSTSVIYIELPLDPSKYRHIMLKILLRFRRCTGKRAQGASITAEGVKSLRSLF